MTTPKSDISLDLDELAPPKMNINFGGKTIAVNPPTLEEYAKIIDFSQQLKDHENEKGVTDSDSIRKIADIYKDINMFIGEVMPEFKNTKLNFAQSSALFRLLSQIGAPSERVLEKLKEQGIDLKASKQSPKVSASRKR